MAGILDVVGIVNNLDYRPKYEKAKCIRNMSPKSECHVCADTCTKNSIKIDKKGITIEESCNFCNECVSYCPTNALVDTGRKFIGVNKKLYLLCGEHELEDDLDNNFRVGCLNFLSTKILLNIYNAGYREIHTNVGKCNNCEKTHNLNVELVRVNKILSELNLPLMSIKEQDVESLILSVKEIGKIKLNSKVDRRGFFKQLAKDVFGKTYEIAPPASKKQFWRSTSYILEKWQHDEQRKVALYSVEFDNNKCIQCNACVKMCPQKVWLINDDGVEIRLDLCNGCNLCQDICPTKAIQVEEEIKLTDRKAFAKSKKNCISCGKEYLTYKKEIEFCPSCIWKMEKNNNASKDKTSKQEESGI